MGDEVIVLRAGDVIPQVISPAPHAVERKPLARRRGRRSAARSATRRRSRPRARSSPSARTATARSAGGSCSRTSSRAGRWTSTASARSRSRCSRTPGSCGPPADFYRLDQGAAARARGRRRGLGDATCSARSRPPRSSRSGACCSRSASRASATSRAATSRPRFRSIDDPAGRHARADRRDARHRADRRAADPRPARTTSRCCALIEDLRGPGCSSSRRARRPARARCATRRFVLTGTLPDLTREQATERILAAGGRVTSRCRRRPTTSSPASRRAPSSRRPSASACRCSTSRACWRCSTPANSRLQVSGSRRR